MPRKLISEAHCVQWNTFIYNCVTMDKGILEGADTTTFLGFGWKKSYVFVHIFLILHTFSGSFVCDFDEVGELKHIVSKHTRMHATYTSISFDDKWRRIKCRRDLLAFLISWKGPWYSQTTLSASYQLRLSSGKLLNICRSCHSKLNSNLCINSTLFVTIPHLYVHR